MRTFVLIGWLVFSGIGLSLAQFTTITGTVVDPNGLPYAFGTISAMLVLPGGISPTLNGNAYLPPIQPAGLDITGHFAFNVADNTLLQPGGTKWNFMVCSSYGTIQPANGRGPKCFLLAAPITISGSTQDISTQLNAVALPLAFSSSVPGGANTTVQYNNSGSFAGDNIFTWSPINTGGFNGPEKSLFLNQHQTFTSDIGVGTQMVSHFQYTNNGTSGAGCLIGGTACSGPYAANLTAVADGPGPFYDMQGAFIQGIYQGSGIISQAVGSAVIVAQQGSGHILEATNVQAEYPDTGSGTVDLWEGFRSWTPPSNSNVRIFRGFHADALTNFSATPSSFYGMYSRQLPSYSGGSLQIAGSDAAAHYVDQSSTPTDPTSVGPTEIHASAACDVTATTSNPTVLSTSSTTTDTAQNCLPANAMIDAVLYAVSVTISTATSFTIGDSTTAARFCASQSGMTAGSRGICFAQADQTGAAGPRQTTAAKVRITTNVNPGAGSIRLFVFYHTWVTPVN